MLKTLLYKPPQDYYGPDYISVYVNDKGYGGPGKSSNETIPIYVQNVNDAPQMIVNKNIFEVNEDERLAMLGCRIKDPDFMEVCILYTI